MTAWLAVFIHRWRLPLSAAAIIGAVLLAPRAQITRIDNDISAWFSRSDPIYLDYERLRGEFSGSRTLIVALEGEDVLSERGLTCVRDLSRAIERVPAVERVYSLATANTVEALADDEDGGIEIASLIERAGAIDAPQVRARALSDPLLVGDLVSADGRVTSLVINFDEDRIDTMRASVLAQIREIVLTTVPSGLRPYFNGSVEISETYNRVTVDNTWKFTPPILVLTCVALYVMFRSVRLTGLILLAVLVSVLWTTGLYTLMGFTFNVLSGMLVPLVVVLAIADDVHIVQHFNEVVRRHGDRHAAFRSTVTHLALPILAASGTTALGLLSLATSDVQAVRVFGIGAAVGVMVDFVISLVLVPTLLTLVPPPKTPAPQERWLLGPMRAIASFSTRRPGTVMGVAAVVAVVAVHGLLRVRVDTNHINFFSRNHPLAESARLIDRDLSGIYSFQVFFEGQPDGMQEPAVLQRMARLGTELEALPNVRKVISVTEYLERINRELHGGDPAAAVVPASRQLIAQELLVFSLTDEGRRELEHVVASDFSRAQMTVRLASMSSDVVFEQILQAQRLADSIFAGSPVKATVTGSGRLFAQLDHYLVMSQVTSFGTAFVTVFAVIFLVFRSLKFGLLALVPNVFPVIVVLGVMGWLDISMNVATVMLASVALGIVDDDTIHFISRFRRETAAGRDVDGAIMEATTHEGRAALTTAVINGCAFAVLMASEYRPTAWFGGLLALTMAVAFLAEVFVLPATIKLFPSVFAHRRSRVGETAGSGQSGTTASRAIR